MALKAEQIKKLKDLAEKVEKGEASESELFHLADEVGYKAELSPKGKELTNQIVDLQRKIDELKPLADEGQKAKDKEKTAEQKLAEQGELIKQRDDMIAKLNTDLTTTKTEVGNFYETQISELTSKWGDEDKKLLETLKDLPASKRFEVIKTYSQKITNKDVNIPNTPGGTQRQVNVDGIDPNYLKSYMRLYGSKYKQESIIAFAKGEKKTFTDADKLPQ